MFLLCTFFRIKRMLDGQEVVSCVKKTMLRSSHEAGDFLSYAYNNYSKIRAKIESPVTPSSGDDHVISGAAEGSLVMLTK